MAARSCTTIPGDSNRWRIRSRKRPQACTGSWNSLRHPTSTKSSTSRSVATNRCYASWLRVSINTPSSTMPKGKVAYQQEPKKQWYNYGKSKRNQISHRYQAGETRQEILPLQEIRDQVYRL